MNGAILKPSPMNFETFSAFFEAYLAWLKTRDGKYSVRWVAKTIGLKSHAHLLRIAKGEKPPSSTLLNFVQTNLKMTPDEIECLKCLLGLCRANSPSETSYWREKLSAYQSKDPGELLSLEDFESVSKWYSLAIWELMETKDFRSDPAWIVARLGQSVSKKDVRACIRRLESMALIEKRQDGTYIKKVAELNTPNGVPSSSIRLYHDEMLNKSREALHNLPAEQRLLFSRVMVMDSRKLPEAMSLIMEFRSRFGKLCTEGDPDEVFQLGIQLVPLTRPFNADPRN